METPRPSNSSDWIWMPPKSKAAPTPRPTVAAPTKKRVSRFAHLFGEPGEVQISQVAKAPRLNSIHNAQEDLYKKFIGDGLGRYVDDAFKELYMCKGWSLETSVTIRAAVLVRAAELATFTPSSSSSDRTPASDEADNS
jgi:hypothetical protein